MSALRVNCDGRAARQAGARQTFVLPCAGRIDLTMGAGGLMPAIWRRSPRNSFLKWLAAIQPRAQNGKLEIKTSKMWG
jgi:hypothetical protein